MFLNDRKSNRIPLFHFILIILLTTSSLCFAIEYSPGVVTGKIIDKNSKPLVGATVSAYDSDSTNSDEFIGKTKTDANGKYVIRIPKRSKSRQWDGPKTSRHTQWRPDIYILVDKPQYKRNKSRVYTDHKLKNNLVINLAMEALPGGRTVKGRIVQADGRTPLAGALVTACDADTGDDQQMGATTTDASGNYNIEYAAGSWDGPKTDRHTQWRPDIFVVVTKDGWKRTKSNTYADQRLDAPLSINVKVTSKPGKRHTLTSNMCETESPAARCKAKGNNYIWLGPENTLGRCTMLRKEVMAIKASTQIGKPRVWGYMAFFETIGSGAKQRELPVYIKSGLSQYFPQNLLKNVKYASSKHTWSGNAMTDCSTIYFPSNSGEGMVAAINNGRLFDSGQGNRLHLLLHELGHTKQCSDWGGRLNYADRWFSQLPTPIVAEILERTYVPGVKENSIHDRMPMEQQVESNADSIMKKMGYTKNSNGDWISPPATKAVPSRIIRSVPSNEKLIAPQRVPGTRQIR